jgi:hypothetical protein
LEYFSTPLAVFYFDKLGATKKILLKASHHHKIGIKQESTTSILESSRVGFDSFSNYHIFSHKYVSVIIKGAVFSERAAAQKGRRSAFSWFYCFINNAKSNIVIFSCV